MNEHSTPLPGTLQNNLRQGRFVMTAELAPPVSCDAAELLEKAAGLKGLADAVNVTDGAALRMRSCASQDRGGVTSAVMTKRPARSRSSNMRGSRALWSFIAGSLTGAWRRQSAYMLCGVTAIAAFLDRKLQCR